MYKPHCTCTLDHIHQIPVTFGCGSERSIIILSGTIGFLKLIQTVKQHHKIDIYSAYTTRAIIYASTIHCKCNV